MIRRVLIHNFNSIYETQEIDFSVTRINYLEGFVLKDVAVINPAIFYGKCGSGKSQVLSVFKVISMVVNNLEYQQLLVSHKFLSDDLQTIRLELEFEVEGFVYIYALEANNSGNLVNERLIFDNVDLLNKKSDTDYQVSLMRQLGLNSGQTNHIRRAFKFLANIEILSGLQLLKDAEFSPSKKVKKIFTYMTSEDLEEVNLLSDGQQRLVFLLQKLDQLALGSLLVIDDLDMGLDPFVMLEVIKIINIEFNIQLIFSAHNTVLMKQVRPDQLFLVDKIEKNTSIRRVNKIVTKLREHQNMEKMYFDKVFDL